MPIRAGSAWFFATLLSLVGCGGSQGTPTTDAGITTVAGGSANDGGASGDGDAGASGDGGEPSTTPNACTSTQTAGDCQKTTCDENGDLVSQPDDSDVPVDGDPCTLDVCERGVPSNPPVAIGTGDCARCKVALDCPGTDSECQTRTCNDGVCGAKNAASGTALQAQTAGDCKKDVCDGKGGITTQADDSDLPGTVGSCNVPPKLAPYESDVACTFQDDVSITFTANDPNLPAQPLTFSVTGGSCPHSLDFTGKTLSGGCPLTGTACTVEFEVSDGLAAAKGKLNFPATARFIAKSGSGAKDGNSWATAFTSLQAASDALPIMVKDDVYSSGDGSPVFQTSATSKYYGGFKGTEASLKQRGSTGFTTLAGASGSANQALVKVTGGNTTFERFRFHDAQTKSGSGGAVSCTSATLEFINSAFVSNTAHGGGGAIAADGCHLTLRSSIFDGNQAVAPVTVANCTPISCTGKDGLGATGGAIVATGASGSLTIDEVVFNGNSAISGAGFSPPFFAGINGYDGGRGAIAQGGAVFTSVPNVSITKSLFYGNSAQAGKGGAGANGFLPGQGGAAGDALGGALYASDTTALTVTDSSFMKNKTTGGSGGAASNVVGSRPGGGTGAAGGAGGASLGGALAASHVLGWTAKHSVFVSNEAVAGFGGAGSAGLVNTTANGTGGTGGSGGAGGRAEGGALYVDGATGTATLDFTSATLASNRVTAGEGGHGGAGGAGTVGTANGGIGGRAGDSGQAHGGAASFLKSSLACLHCTVDDNRAITAFYGLPGPGGASAGSGGLGGVSGSSSPPPDADGAGFAVSSGLSTIDNSAFFANVNVGVIRDPLPQIMTPEDIKALAGATVNLGSSCVAQASLVSPTVKQLSATPFSVLSGGERLVSASSACVEAGNASVEGAYPWSTLFNLATFAVDAGPNPDAGAHYALATTLRSSSYTRSTALLSVTLGAGDASDCRVFDLGVDTITPFTTTGTAPMPVDSKGFVRCGSSFVGIDTH